MASDHVSTGEIARRVGEPVWKIRRLFDRGFLPKPPRVGLYRLIPLSALPEIRKALKRAALVKRGPKPKEAAVA